MRTILQIIGIIKLVRAMTREIKERRKLSHE